MKKAFFIVFCSILVINSISFAASPEVRIKDIARILEARDNQLMGFGLVVGLRQTGDTSQTGFTKQALTNLLSRMGIPPQTGDFRSRNVAAVIVTANLPPFVKSGQKLDVVVSSVGDASSLRGGTLLLTPLFGPDEEVYAVAQGPVSFGGADPSQVSVAAAWGSATAGRIPSGAIVEKNVPVSIGEKVNHIILAIDNPDFTTAARIAESISMSGIDAKVKDAATVIVPFFKGEDPIELVSKLENLTVIPDSVARIVIDERTGTIVIGENVRLAPVAVSYQGFNVVIASSASVSSGAKGAVGLVAPGGNIRDVVRALNALGATPRDLISILQAIKAAGALSAELEII